VKKVSISELGDLAVKSNLKDTERHRMPHEPAHTTRSSVSETGETAVYKKCVKTEWLKIPRIQQMDMKLQIQEDEQRLNRIH
jgi:predicted ATP-dependent protease